MRLPHPRLGTEVVEVMEAQNRVGEGGWHGGFDGVGEVLLAVHQVVMDLGIEGKFDLGYGSLEKDLIAAARGALHRETFGLQPGHYFSDVALGHAEAVGVLLRSQPLVIVWRGGILLRSEE